MPDCYSDNGVSPSPGAAKPQCGTCAACPQNVWGSKVSPSGAKVKACSDSKRLAVLVTELDEPSLYELSVPATSLRDMHEVIGKLDGQGIPVPAVVFELGFDNDASYPKLKFRPVGFIDEEQAALVQKLQGSDEVKQAIGTAPAVQEQGPEVSIQLSKASPHLSGNLTIAPKTEAPVFPTHTFAPVVDEEPVKKPRKAKEPVQQDLPLPVPKAAVQAMEVTPTLTNSDLDAKLEELFANVKF
jgi:hypothetical protein